MKYTVTKSFVQVIGTIWMPAVTCAQEITLDSRDIESIESDQADFEDWRAAVEHYLGTHTGDFQSIDDFRADLETSRGNIVIEWKSEESELTYNDCMFGSEDL